jgi:hypothetical protein
MSHSTLTPLPLSPCHALSNLRLSHMTLTPLPACHAWHSLRDRNCVAYHKISTRAFPALSCYSEASRRFMLFVGVCLCVCVWFCGVSACWCISVCQCICGSVHLRLRIRASVCVCESECLHSPPGMRKLFIPLSTSSCSNVVKSD